MKRNFLVTLLLSQGVPMLSAGDELGRTQAGNNNAYCQDNTVSWIDWNADGDWSDAGDHVFTDSVLTAGVNKLTITVPASAVA